MNGPLWINGPWPGNLAILPRPRGGDWLESETRAWRQTGLNVVVSVLTPDEVGHFDLDQEKRHSEAAGIEFREFRSLIEAFHPPKPNSRALFDSSTNGWQPER